MSQFDQRNQRVERDQFNIDRDAYFRPPLSLSERQQQNYRTYLINQVRFFWIQGVLEPSLQEGISIRQGLQMQPDTVVNPYHESVQESNQPTHTLPPQTFIVQVYGPHNCERSVMESDHAVMVL